MRLVKIVNLRVFKSKAGSNEVLYNEKREVKNENQIVALIHGIKEWYNYLDKLIANQFIEVKIESYLEKAGDGDYVEKDIPDEIYLEVLTAFRGEDEAVKIMASRPKKEEPKKVTKKEISPELVAARAEFKEKTGKDAHHKASVESIQEKISELEDSKS